MANQYYSYWTAMLYMVNVRQTGALPISVPFWLAMLVKRERRMAS